MGDGKQTLSYTDIISYHGQAGVNGPAHFPTIDKLEWRRGDRSGKTIAPCSY